MLFSYEWLKEFIPDIPKPEELLEKLTMHSVEVEEIDKGAQEPGKVVVGEILEVKEHPNADTLNIAMVDVGEDKPRQIIFGGLAELEAGNKIPIALAPTVLPGNLKIKERKLRGELSQGMCCLNSELGILDREEVVHFFEDEVLNGTPITGILPLGETVIDIDNKSMTHRSDLFCHINMAREIAAVFDKGFTTPSTKPLPKKLPKVDVTIKDPEDCARYIGIEVEVEVGASPDDIGRRLSTCGVKTINNVVDITNYVMLELDEPMHAFDADKIEGDRLIIRRAKPGESLQTLDHETKKLDDSVLVIADAKKPVAIAGVIGGEASGVTADTKRIILEVANFDALLVRKAGQKLGIRTESLVRWEKGLPSGLAHVAAERAVALLQEHANAKVVGLVDLYPRKSTNIAITLTQEYLSRVTGIVFTKKQVKDYLTRLGCTIKASSQKYVVTPPWFRTDLKIPEDLIEEVVRLHGVHNITEQPLTGELAVGDQQPELPWIRQVRHTLAGMGLTEVLNYSFYGEKLIRKAGYDPEKEHIELQNPLSDDLRYLRVNLLPRMLENIALNQFHKDSFGLFEIGHVYFADREVQQLGIVVTGVKEPYRVVRGYAEALLRSLNITFSTQMADKTVPCEFWGMYEADQALRFDVGKQIIGTAGTVDSSVLQNMDIEKSVGFCTLSIPVLAKHAKSATIMKPISPFPAIPLDLSLIVDEDQKWEVIEKEAHKQAGDLLQTIEVFDVYQGKGIPSGKKSISFHIVLQSGEETLEMAEIEKWREELVGKLEKSIGAKLREK
ncbi:phenylalanine--tRNA ligase subunit beta [Patescibacteria group bacterium]